MILCVQPYGTVTDVEIIFNERGSKVKFVTLSAVKKVKAEYSSSWESISELRGVTCRMGSHRVTCHPTQVNAPRYNLSQPGRYSIYLPRRDGRLS